MKISANYKGIEFNFEGTQEELFGLYNLVQMDIENDLELLFGKKQEDIQVPYREPEKAPSQEGKVLKKVKLEDLSDEVLIKILQDVLKGA